MGWPCNGFGWRGLGNRSGMGSIAPILTLAFFAGVLIVLGLTSVWLIRQLRYGATAP